MREGAAGFSGPDNFFCFVSTVILGTTLLFMK